MTVICSLDVGKKGAIVIYEDGKFPIKEEFSFVSMEKLYHKLDNLVALYGVNLFLIGEAFGQRCVVKAHSKFYGVIELVAEQNDIETVYVSDCTARAKVLGVGNGRRKDLVHEKYKEATPDLSDARLFIDWYLLSI